MNEHWGYCDQTGRPHVPSDMEYTERTQVDKDGRVIGLKALNICKHCHKYFERRTK